MPPKGRLQVKVYEGDSYIPIQNAKVTMSKVGANKLPQLTTNDIGETDEIDFDTPPIELSLTPTGQIPYSLADVTVEVPGYRTMRIKGCQILPEILALQECYMEKTRSRQGEEQIIDILPNRLVGNFPPKIPEDPNKPDPVPPSGFVVLPEPVIPQYIVVHAGVPDDTTAPNYTVKYRNYIKNVASCEIFSTWPESAIRANILCIISFTLNRIYTEWYRNKGKNFQITSSTAYDHAFSYGRNIYANISNIVDQIFATYVKRPSKKQPLLTQYCDGIKVQCPNWLTQWGSKFMADKGVTPFNILKHFYGEDLTLTTAKKVIGVPSSYPGYVLSIGSTGAPVRTIQSQLNRISVNYPDVPKVAVSGIYNSATQNAVKIFQRDFNLTPTGNVNYATWYKISDIYVAVSQIAELRGKEGIFIPPVFNDELMYNGVFVPPSVMSAYVPQVTYLED